MRLRLFILISILCSAIYAKDGENSALNRHLQEQIAKEQKYAKERAFYQGKDYNLSANQVDTDTLKSVPLIEPEDDFDMTDVYRDDI